MASIKLKQGTPAHRAYAMGRLDPRRARPHLRDVRLQAPGSPPGSIDKAFRITQINDVIAYAVAILGLNLVIGYSGQLSLGHSAFVGLGAYTTIILVVRSPLELLRHDPGVGRGCASSLGLIVGLPALRIRGLYLAIVTLSLAFVFPTLVLKYD